MDFRPPAEFAYMLDGKFGASTLKRSGLETYAKMVSIFISDSAPNGHPRTQTRDPIDALNAGRINCIEASALFLYAFATRPDCIPALLTTPGHAEAVALMPRSGKTVVCDASMVYRDSNLDSLPESARYSVLARWQRENRASGLYRAYSFDAVSPDSAESVRVCNTFFGYNFDQQIILPTIPTESAALSVGADALPAAQAIIGYFASTGEETITSYKEEHSHILPRLQPIIDPYSAVR